MIRAPAIALALAALSALATFAACEEYPDARDPSEAPFPVYRADRVELVSGADAASTENVIQPEIAKGSAPKAE